jgi:hypothetical protein
MRAAVGFAGAHALYLVAGWAAVYALGLIDLRPREVVKSAGLALLAGIAIVTTVLTALLVARVPVTLLTFVLVALAVAVALAAAGWLVRRSGRMRPLAPLGYPLSRAERLIALGLVAAVALWVVVEAIESRRFWVGWDAAHIWMFKAVALTEAPELRLEVADNPVIAAPNFSGQDYPILQPVLMSTVFRAMGGANVEQGPFEIWVLVLAFVGAVAFVAARFARGPLWPIPVVALVPSATVTVLLFNADVTLAAFCALGALGAALWLRDGHTRYLVLAAVMLGGAINTKVEGVGFAMIVLVAAVVTRVWPRRWAELRAGALALGVVVAFMLPWWIWNRIHDPHENQPAAPLSEALDPGFLADRKDQLDFGLHKLVEVLADQGRFAWIVPAFLVLAVACLLTDTRRRLAAFYLTSSGLCFLALVWVYWTTKAGDPFEHIVVTVDRIVLTPIWIAAIGLVHLLATFELTPRSGAEASGS